MKIKDLRMQIDKLDHAIIDLIAKRFELVKEIGSLKKENGIEPLDTKRFYQVLMDRVAYARERGVSEKLIETVWHDIHDHSLEIEKSDE
ncbi:MAG: chorismate mutase [bacterium]|nr:chorismate mutase [bacterium]